MFQGTYIEEIPDFDFSSVTNADYMCASGYSKMHILEIYNKLSNNGHNVSHKCTFDSTGLASERAQIPVSWGGTKAELIFKNITQDAIGENLVTVYFTLNKCFDDETDWKIKLYEDGREIGDDDSCISNIQGEGSMGQHTYSLKAINENTSEEIDADKTIPLYLYNVCDECDGSGKITDYDDNEIEITCTRCNGTGKI